jgi:hypothetical protein
MAEEPGKFATESPRAATVETYGVHRQVKVIGVLEYELQTVSELNAQATVWVSVATALISLAAGIGISAAYVDKLTPEGTVLLHFGAPVLCMLGLVCVGLAVHAWRSRVATVSRMLEESKPGGV